MRSNQVRKLVYVIGMGPGNFEQMTFEARRALEQSDVIVGYTVYVDLLREHFPEKQFLTTPMRQEVERCRMAFEEAKKGQTVAMVCSGDAGVYGMSGLILELQQEYPECEVEVVSGVTAALAGGAVLGAPLMHDFAVISLSDLLTPWEKIETRLRCAAEGGFFHLYLQSVQQKTGRLFKTGLRYHSGTDKGRPGLRHCEQHWQGRAERPGSDAQ